MSTKPVDDLAHYMQRVGHLRAENQRLHKELAAMADDAITKLRTLRAENERLRAALEKIARSDLACDESHCAIAREALHA